METSNHELKQPWSLTVVGVNLDRSLGVLQQVLSNHGLIVSHSTHLSDIHVDRGVWECVVTGPTGSVTFDDVRSIQAAVKQSLGDIDCWLQPHTLNRAKPGLAIFDMDSTLIEVEVIDELAKELGIGAEVAAITEQCMRGALDFTSSFIKRLALLRGIQESSLDKIAASLPIMPGAHRLFNYLRAIGCHTALVSGGFTYFALTVKEALGIDVVCANELEIIHGLVTGDPVLPVVDAQRKRDELVRLAKHWGVALDNTVAVGDGANDLKMIAAAGKGIAFKAKPIVQEQAAFAINKGGLDYLLYLMGVSDSQYSRLVCER